MSQKRIKFPMNSPLAAFFFKKKSQVTWEPWMNRMYIGSMWFWQIISAVPWKVGRKMMKASLHLLVISYTSSNVGKTCWICWILLARSIREATQKGLLGYSSSCMCRTKSPNFVRMWRAQRWTIATSMTIEAFWGHLNALWNVHYNARSN